MRLAARLATPRVKRVVHDEAMAQLLVVVGKQARQPKRDRQEPRRLRSEVESRRVSRPDDRGDRVDGRILDAVLLDERVEAAARTDVRQLDPLYVVRNRAELGGLRRDVRGRDEDELGVAIDKPLDEPGTGNAVDLGAFAGDPAHGASER